MINDHEIMQKAFEQAQALIERAQADATQIIASAQNDADNVRVSALRYTDELLGKVQIIASDCSQRTGDSSGICNNKP